MKALLQRLAALKIERSFVIAGAVLVLVVLWFASGLLNRRAEPDKAPGTAILAERPTVRVMTSRAEPRETTLTLRGRTEASRIVVLRAETAGTVMAVPAVKGTRVAEGTVICKLAVDAREAELAEARAGAEQRRLEYVASEKLGRKGHRSETQVAASRAAYEGAQALVMRMETEIARTEIRAPFDGVLDSRPAEIGDYLAVGDACGTLVDVDPILVVAQASEREVPLLALGMTGTARLITGETLSGAIRFVASAAEQETRTFRVELEVPNPDHLPALRDGVTSDLVLAVKTVTAHRLSPSVLTLDDRGVVGVRIVDADGTARFMPIDVAADTPDGLWVRGLPEAVTIITTGQDFVLDGQPVNAVPADKGMPS